ncbi:MAG: hypothetical protein FJ088_01770 [Deltaproteobacteria bacterium]|nr:hypothetical protein [Deltaproteobacteria bacterium]
MSAVKEIVEAVSHLSKKDLAAFRKWFAEFDAGVWDKQLEKDVSSGKLDRLAEEALKDLKEGRCSNL